jgi:hypothetical protein
MTNKVVSLEGLSAVLPETEQWESQEERDLVAPALIRAAKDFRKDVRARLDAGEEIDVLREVQAYYEATRPEKKDRMSVEANAQVVLRNATEYTENFLTLPNYENQRKSAAHMLAHIGVLEQSGAAVQLRMENPGSEDYRTEYLLGAAPGEAPAPLTSWARVDERFFVTRADV